jgi:amino acid transporter
MSEEVQDASKTVPNVIMWAVGANAVMLLLVGITYIFCLGDLDSALNSPTYQPVIQVFYNATKSKAGTNTMVAVIIIIFMSACVGQVATASRQMWSFARDKGQFGVLVSPVAPSLTLLHIIGLPFSDWLEQVPAGWNIPIHAIIVSATVTSLLSLIAIGMFDSTSLQARPQRLG